MIHHLELNNEAGHLRRLIRSGEVRFGGYSKGRIYGLLSCSAGKRMKLENRVFFKYEEEAVHVGYRPCGRCMPEKYRFWKLKTYGNEQ